MSRVILCLMFVTAAAGCKEKADTGEEPASEPRTIEPTATGDDDAAAQAVPEVPALTDEAHIAYRADTGEQKPATWTIEGTDIALRVAPLGDDGSGFVVGQIMAKVGDGVEAQETGIYSCKSLSKAAGGYVDFMLRAGKLHIRCINPAVDQEPGDTEAGRFDFDSSSDAIVAAGNYSGEGIVDPDTIDLDEGE